MKGQKTKAVILALMAVAGAVLLVPLALIALALFTMAAR